MKMKTYRVTLTGTTPLLLHHDNIPWADRMEVWKNDPESKKKSRAGDDRSPGFRWIGCLYHDDNVVSLPSEVLMPLAMQGGMMVPVPGAKGNKNFKSQTQSGSMIGEPFWPLLVNGKTIPMARINSLLHEEDFEKHQDLAARLGFMLFVKRAKVGMSKHIRVRPRFDHWSAGGTLNVWDDQLTLGVLRKLRKGAQQVESIPAQEVSPAKIGVLDHTRNFFAKVAFAARMERTAVLRAKKIAALTGAPEEAAQEARPS